MKLTRRQAKFIEKMIELKHEFASPIHYSVLAERLGVSPFTAYDMLCLLEEKGFVTSEYQLPADKSGPGRAERLFYPSEMAQAHHQEFIQHMPEGSTEASALQALDLEKLRRGGPADPELAEQMMARLLPAGRGEVRYCVEVMTIAADRLKHSPWRETLLEHLPELVPGFGTPGEPPWVDNRSYQARLGLLAGFIYSLLAQHFPNSPEWLEVLREHLLGYLDLVMGMNATECTRLAKQLHAVFLVLAEARG